MQKDKWYCITCKRLFLEPSGFDIYDGNPKFKLSCPHCHSHKTVNTKPFMEKYDKFSSMNNKEFIVLTELEAEVIRCMLNKKLKF